MDRDREREMFYYKRYIQIQARYNVTPSPRNSLREAPCPNSWPDPALSEAAVRPLQCSADYWLPTTEELQAHDGNEKRQALRVWEFPQEVPTLAIGIGKRGREVEKEEREGQRKGIINE